MGTYYHLWYLITCSVSIYIVYFLINKLGLKKALIISLFLYIFSLLGDSYYGLPIGKFRWFIDVYIGLFGEVWNSFIWVLIFILMGICIRKYNLNKKLVHGKFIFFITYCLFIIEHFILRYLGIAQDNNTSIFLLALAPVIFMNVLNLEDKINSSFITRNSIILKNISLNIYLVHPLIKFYIIKGLNINNSVTLFGIVLILSIIFSYMFYYIERKIKFNFNKNV